MIEFRRSETTYLGKNAEGRDRYSLDCSIDAVQFSDTVIIKANISSVVDFDAGQYNLHFDHDSYEIVAITNGNIGGVEIPVSLWNELSPGEVIVIHNIPGLTGATGSGYLSEIRLRPIKIFLNSTMSLSDVFINDIYAEALPASAVSLGQVEKQWHDIDPSIEEPDSEGFSIKFTGTPMLVRVAEDSHRRIYPDRTDLSYWIELGKPFPNMGTPTRHNRWFYWDFLRGTIGVRVDKTSIKFGFRLKDQYAPTDLTIPFTSQGLTRQGRMLYHDGELVAILRRPIATGSNYNEQGRPVERECQVAFAPGEITISLDPTGLEYPIDIDPTIDVDVGASGDDGYWYATTFNNSATTMNVGTVEGGVLYSLWALFTGISGLSGATIDVSYYSLYLGDANADARTKVRADKQAAPSAPSDIADYNGRTQTTAGVDWDGANPTYQFVNSPSLNTVIQELADSLDPSAILIMHEDDGGLGNYDYYWAYTWDYDDHSRAPALHIEYTAAAAGVVLFRRRIEGE